MNAIKTRNLSKSYGLVKALSDVSFDVERGEVIGLLGPNGAGKTTLMKILTGYLQPNSGTAHVTGTDVVADPLEVQSKIGYLPESAPLYGDMIVQEYLQMMAELRSIPLERRRRYLSEAIYATGIEEYLTRPIRTLSKGYRQRVGIAQAIAHKPELLILDEPTTGLDPAQIVEIRQLIKDVAVESTVILSTHILPEVEMTCERVLIIVRGKLREDRPLGELRDAYASNIAVLSVAGASGVREVLAKIDGVSAVDESGKADDGYVSYRVTADKSVELCPAIFAAIRNQDWKVGELRNDAKTLETVFRELAETDDDGVITRGSNR